MFKPRFMVMPLVLTLSMILGLLSFPQVQVRADTTDLFFSEYVEGSSNNKALEIYNGTAAAVDLAAGGYAIQMYFNGSSSAGLTISLTGTVAAGDVYVIAQSSADPAILAVADQTNGSGWFNGDDAVALVEGSTTLDVIGQIGTDPGSEWGSGLTSTADNTLRRKSTICSGDPNGSDAFDPSVEWDGYANNTFDGLGSHTATCGTAVDTAPSVTGTSPADGASGVSPSDNIVVTFSEPVDLSGDWFSLDCSVTGTRGVADATVSGGPTEFTIDPNSDFDANESCTLTVFAADVTDQDTIDPPDNMNADFSSTFSTQNVCSLSYTPIYDIQGSGLTAAITGPVTTEGVVVGDYEGPSPALRGFYLQDLTGDGDPATSDGIFVFNGNNDSVSLGDVVRVSGSASDYQDQTEIDTLSSITPCGTGSVEPTDVTLPFPSADYPERYEGMLVRLPQTLYVTEIYQLGRFGQVTLSSGDRLQEPTNLVSPGTDANALQAANNLNSILLDDNLNNQDPDPVLFGRGGNPLSASNTLRGGDSATGIVGVMTYTWAGNSASGNAYRVRPIDALGGGVPDFQAANPRPNSSPAPAGRLRVAGMNLLNFFNTFGSDCTLGVGGDPTDCRGADNSTEFDRQWAKTVAAVTGTQADIIGVTEMENNGYGPDSAIQFLVDRLNDATAPGTYAFIDADAATGQVNALGTDAIKVGLIYKPAKVTPVGTTAVLNSPEFVTGGDSADRNRPSLAQAFQEVSSGASFVVDVNHLKSKGSACDAPDALDGQANCNTVRTNAANLLTTWLAGDPTGTGQPDVLIVGDLNSYAKEDPITAIQSAGYTNLVAAFEGDQAYSYVFDGEWGYLDHALGTAGMTPEVVNVADWHINSDEPTELDYNTDFKSAGQLVSMYSPDEFRASDHDPVLVDINLDSQAPTVNIHVTPDELWPPNHKYVNVTASVTATDDTDPSPTIQLVSVTSNEPDQAEPGDKPNDIVILDDFHFQLRAERLGNGNGRVYTITYSVSDAAGNVTVKSAEVTVPKNQSHKGH